MSSEVSVNDDVKELIGEIIKKNNWDPVSDVKYYPGTQAGDGYASKHVAVDIIKGDKIFRIFVKYALNVQHLPHAQFDQIYANEAYFYDVINPAYVQFLRKRNIQNGFQNVPKCYGTSTKNVIGLENLRERGFSLFNRKEIMNDKHIKLTLRTFAKFHAISFAFKDQERENYDKLVAGIVTDPIRSDMNGPMPKMLGGMINEAISKLDAKADKHIIEKCDVGILVKAVVDSKSYLDEYNIITQGDCWCNNMMYLYEKENKEYPTDIMLVDWQLCRTAPPVLDISYFFYTIASEEALNNLNFYLEEYYAELCEQIKKLGSDPDKLYPFSIFQKQWKQYCKYGLAMAFPVFRHMLASQDEVINLEDLNAEKMKESGPSIMFHKFRNESEFVKRLRTLAGFMVKNDYL